MAPRSYLTEHIGSAVRRRQMSLRKVWRASCERCTVFNSSDFTPDFHVTDGMVY
jgi:hypothetical protein